MPVFELRVPAGRFGVEDKNALADACNHSLVQALGVPEGDRFVALSEHGPGELHLHPDFLSIERNPADAMLITVLIGAHRPFEDKQALVATLNKLIVSAVGDLGRAQDAVDGAQVGAEDGRGVEADDDLGGVRDRDRFGAEVGDSGGGVAPPADLVHVAAVGTRGSAGPGAGSSSTS